VTNSGHRVVEASSLPRALIESARSLRDNGEWTLPIADPLSIGSAFGTHPRRTLEMLGVQIRIDDPRARLMAIESRPVHLDFAFANYFWTLSGTSDASPVLVYNPKGASLVTPQNQFAGAMGARISAAYGEPSAIRVVVDALRRDPASRRAVMPIFLTGDLLDPPLDAPCAIACQFLLRNGKIHAITYMRSQSLVGLLYYDLFLFSMIQETVAVELGCDVGTYIHSCGSLHIYEDEYDRLTELADEELPSVALNMDPMIESPLSRGDILKAEEIERECIVGGNELGTTIRLGAIPNYWLEILAVMSYELRTSMFGGQASGLRAVRDILEHRYGAFLDLNRRYSEAAV